MVEVSTVTVKSVTLQRDGKSDSVVRSVFLLLDGARILSVSEP